MNYKQKFLKYKKKLQLGGSSEFVLNLDEWTSIPNSGQQNCGIFLSEKYPDFIVKCDSSDTGITHVNYINNKIQLFPLIINIKNVDGGAYITMQKLDGDITSIYFDLFPKIILDDMIKNSLINEEQKNNILLLFKKHSDPGDSDDDLINSARLVRSDTYNSFIHKLFELWELYHPIITKEMIKKRLLLIPLGYDYHDNKFDNYAYILNDIPDDKLTPKIFDKYLHVYFLDWKSGLKDLNNSNIKYEIEEIINNINTGLDYGIFGGYNFNNTFKTIDNSSNLDPEMNKILQKKYIFDFSKFQHAFTNITDLEEYIFGEEKLHLQQILDYGYPEDILLKHQEREINFRKQKLESSEDFIESGQDINDFNTLQLIAEEMERLDDIKALKSRPDFIESGQDIRDFQTSDKIDEEIRRLEQVNMLAKNRLFIASGQNIKDFQTWQSAYDERMMLNLKDDLMHSETFKASGIDINSIDFSTLTNGQINYLKKTYTRYY